MKRTWNRRVALTLLGGLLTVGSACRPARAQSRQPSDPKPDAFVEIEQVRLGVLTLGASVGGGRLRFRGGEYAFSIRGLESSSLGIATFSASGEVFNLRRLEDFPGYYQDQAASHPPDGKDRPEAWLLRNQAGVELRLHTDRGRLNIDPAGVAIELR